MKKLVSIILVLLVIGIGSVLTGCQTGLASRFQTSKARYLPIDYSEADKNSREIWFKFEKEYTKRYDYRNKADCSFLKGTGSYLKEEYTILRNGRVLYSVDINSRYSYEFLGLKVVPSSALISSSGMNGLRFEDKLKFELHQNIQKIAINYSGGYKSKKN